jgi:2-polyprenyl-3-methyl-5-hydroxy-6-metoxy-1,4-benzoquinol methylase
MSHRSSGIFRIFETAAVYERVQRLIGGEAGRRRFEREFVRPAPGARILDIGCGTGAVVEHLPAGVDYVGYDFNPRYIEEARRRFAGRGRFYCGRVEEAPQEAEGYDLVLAMAILHHLEDAQADGLVESARAQLRPGGCLVTLDPVRHPGQSALTRLLLALDRGRRVRTPEEYRGLAAARFASVDSTLLTDLNRIPYSHFVMRASAGEPPPSL